MSRLFNDQILKVKITPRIEYKGLVPTKLSELINDDNTVKDPDYVRTDHNFTSTLKNKLDNVDSFIGSNIFNEYTFTIDKNNWGVDIGDYESLNETTIESTEYVLPINAKDTDTIFFSFTDDESYSAFSQYGIRAKTQLVDINSGKALLIRSATPPTRNIEVLAKVTKEVDFSA